MLTLLTEKIITVEMSHGLTLPPVSDLFVCIRHTNDDTYTKQINGH